MDANYPVEDEAAVQEYYSGTPLRSDPQWTAYTRWRRLRLLGIIGAIVGVFLGHAPLLIAIAVPACAVVLVFVALFNETRITRSLQASRALSRRAVSS